MNSFGSTIPLDEQADPHVCKKIALSDDAAHFTQNKQTARLTPRLQKAENGRDPCHFERCAAAAVLSEKREGISARGKIPAALSLWSLRGPTLEVTWQSKQAERIRGA